MGSKQTTASITTTESAELILIPHNADKNTRTRLRRYTEWLESTGKNLLDIDLESYKNHLLVTLKPSSASVYLSEVRKSYYRLLDNRQFFFDRLPDDMPFSEKKSYVDELSLRMQIALKTDRAKVKQTKIQDKPDNAHIRLNGREVLDMLKLPDTSDLIGIRDKAILSLLFATGCREGELTNAKVNDLNKYFGDELAFYVRHGKGRKSRMIPYGDLLWMLESVHNWLEVAGITNGYVFRRVYKGRASVGKSKISEYAVQIILAKYPALHKGEKVILKPHDCRRTYAYNLFHSGMDIYRISKNLGHESVKTTELYIGNLSSEERRPGKIYDW